MRTELYEDIQVNIVLLDDGEVPPSILQQYSVNQPPYQLDNKELVWRQSAVSQLLPGSGIMLFFILALRLNTIIAGVSILFGLLSWGLLWSGLPQAALSARSFDEVDMNNRSVDTAHGKLSPTDRKVRGCFAILLFGPLILPGCAALVYLDPFAVCVTVVLGMFVWVLAWHSEVY